MTIVQIIKRHQYSMPILRPALMRRSLDCYARPPWSAQRRWARVHDVRFVATQQPQERILNRYRDKLEQKAREKGVESIDELKKVYKDDISRSKKSSSPTTTTTSQHLPHESSNTPEPPQPLDQLSPSNPNYKTPGVKTLSSFLDLTKTVALPSREIEALWRLRHASNAHSLCATIPTSTFRAIADTAKRFPQFVLPGLPQAKPDEQAAPPTAGQQDEAEGAAAAAAGNAPIHFLQWTFPAPHTATVMFTHLAEYKLRGEWAQPHTTVTHHLELADAKGLVLCQGNVVEGRGVSLEEGRWLVMCMQKFYNTRDVRAEDGAFEGESDIGKELNRRRRRLVEQFGSGSSDFSVHELLAESERLG